MSLCRATGKRRYHDEVTVRAVGSSTCREFGLQKLAVYRCPFCRGWHLTRNNKGRAKRVTPDETHIARSDA